MAKKRFADFNSIEQRLPLVANGSWQLFYL